ncbi:hypothetical protein V9T40_014234 [Parthenolecanium corni]|uniref:Uncharacterized protein n=1 Tax=Parthenolecanium corni TaxID=536013 RepID=A0AAN9Y1X4_9HEMI
MSTSPCLKGKHDCDVQRHHHWTPQPWLPSKRSDQIQIFIKRNGPDMSTSPCLKGKHDCDVQRHHHWTPQPWLPSKHSDQIQSLHIISMIFNFSQVCTENVISIFDATSSQLRQVSISAIDHWGCHQLLGFSCWSRWELRCNHQETLEVAGDSPTRESPVPSFIPVQLTNWVIICPKHSEQEAQNFCDVIRKVGLTLQNLLVSVQLTNWVIIYPKRSEQEAQNFCDILHKVGLTLQNLLVSVQLTNWVIIYPKRSEQEAQNFCNLLQVSIFAIDHWGCHQLLGYSCWSRWELRCNHQEMLEVAGDSPTRESPVPSFIPWSNWVNIYPKRSEHEARNFCDVLHKVGLTLLQARVSFVPYLLQVSISAIDHWGCHQLLGYSCWSRLELRCDHQETLEVAGESPTRESPVPSFIP